MKKNQAEFEKDVTDRYKNMMEEFRESADMYELLDKMMKEYPDIFIYIQNEIAGVKNLINMQASIISNLTHLMDKIRMKIKKLQEYSEKEDMEH